jgi:hypothetical protein
MGLTPRQYAAAASSRQARDFVQEPSRGRPLVSPS